MRVLLATDGSAGAAIAAELVRTIPWPLDTSVEAVRVVAEADGDRVAEVWPAIGSAVTRDLSATAVREAEEALMRVVEPLNRLGLKTTHAVLRGRPADALLDWIDRYRPDLVISGTRGASVIEHAFVGSVSAELVDRSPVPVLVARRPTLERVVVAVDGSDIASEALATVRRWPFLAMTDIRTLSVAPGPATWWPREQGARDGDIAPHDRDAAADVLLEHDTVAAEAAVILRTAGFNVRSEVRVGSPAQTIVEFAREWDADLVILGSHGRTGIARLLLGSVARSVLHRAACSVVVIRRHATPVRATRVDAGSMAWTA